MLDLTTKHSFLAYREWLHLSSKFFLLMIVLFAYAMKSAGPGKPAQVRKGKITEAFARGSSHLLRVNALQ